MAEREAPGFMVSTSDNMLIGMYEDEGDAEAAARSQVYQYVRTAVVPCTLYIYTEEEV